MKQSKHEKHTCQSIVISCMDFRLRKYLRNWTTQYTLLGGFDRVAIAGGVKNFPFIIEQVELSVKLHNICEAYLINHEDCGAYGKEGNFEKHKEDLLLARDILKQKFPNLKIIPLYLKLNGEFIKIS